MSEAVATSQQGLVEKYQPYPEYKDSGVEWLGDIPIHWIVRRLKHTASIQSGIPKGKNLTDKTTISVPMLRVANVQDGYLNLDDIHQIDIEPHELERYSLRKGDVLMNEGGDNDKLGRGAVWQGEIEPCIHQNHVFVIRTENIEPEWLQQLMQSSYAKFYFYSVAKQSTNLASISSSNIKETPLFIPPKPERIKVLSFLNYETARIDRLISQQQRLIELLKEKRQAVISHAVTKGLNPDTPMKDSGIEWLGQVPEHWGESPLKNILSIKHGFAFDGNKFSDSGEYILMTPGNFNEHGGFRAKAPEKYFVGDDFSTDFILSAGQLLVAMTEQAPGLLGSALFVPSEKCYLHNQRLGLVTDVRESDVSIQYLYHIFNSIRYRAEVSASATGAKVRHSSTEKMLSIKVYLPPLLEQGQIVRYLHDKINAIETLNKKVQTAIELLKERRTALISSAITGKIDLRGWTPPAEEAAA